MLKKGGRFAVGIFPEGFLVRIAQISYVFTFLASNLFGKFTALRIPHVSIYLPITHCARQGDIQYL